MATARKSFVVVMAFGMLAILTAFAQAKELNIPSFPDDFVSSGFEILPIALGGRSENIIAPPELTYGVESPDDHPGYGTPNCLQMKWEADIPDLDARAGWRLLFGEDPDLTNHWLSLSVHPPGNWIPDPNLAGQWVFSGIKQIDVVIADRFGATITGWGFNTDQAFPGPNPPPNLGFPLSSGIGGYSVPNNLMSNVLISIGNGAVANSAWVTDPLTGLVYTGPNYIVPVTSAAGLANAWTLDFYEDAVFRGSYPIPGTGVIVNGDTNWWDHINLSATPEPGTWAMLVCGALASLICVGWRRLRR
jgi:hypothetical protein